MLNQDQWNSLIRALSTFIGGLLVTKGVISASDSTVLTTALITLAGAIITAAPAIWGVMSHTQTAQIAAVNNDKTNGRKVVDESSTSPMVTTTRNN